MTEPNYEGRIRDLNQLVLDKDVQIEELARISALVTDALCDALPYVEDALKDEGFKPGAVQKVVTKIRAALEKAGATSLSTPSVGGGLAEENERLREALLAARPHIREQYAAAHIPSSTTEKARNIRIKVLGEVSDKIDAALSGKDRT